MFSNILPALGVRNALQSVEYSIHPIFEISLSATLLNTLCYLCNTPEHRNNAFLGMYLVQG